MDQVSASGVPAVNRFLRFRSIAAVAPLLAACELPLGACDDMLRPNLVVEVQDAATGAALPPGATGTAVHSGGEVTELASFGDAPVLHGQWSQERSGRYTVTVRKPGYLDAVQETRVSMDACHVRTRRLVARLQRDTRQVSVEPSALRLDPRETGFTQSAEVRVTGRTVEITGMALAPCTSLQTVAFRLDLPTEARWHIQLEPDSWAPLGSCAGPAHMQPFTATFVLQPGVNRLLVTGAAGLPVVLFEGTVYGS
jgi:hypothetical protein